MRWQPSSKRFPLPITTRSKVMRRLFRSPEAAGLQTDSRNRTLHPLQRSFHSSPRIFYRSGTGADFLTWLGQMQESRRERNRLLIDKLRQYGIEMTLEEVEKKGRSLTGRPHFARVMVEKGYVPDMETAFREYLDESARAYVERQDPQLSQSIARVRQAGGIPSIAHPVRIFRNDYDKVDALIREMIPHGLTALEAYHSDHKPGDIGHYLEVANRYGLAVTGGSDFHGANKPRIQLGTGNGGNLAIPYQVLDDLMAAHLSRPVRRPTPAVPGLAALTRT